MARGKVRVPPAMYPTLDAALAARKDENSKIYRVVQTGQPDAFVITSQGVLACGIVGELRHGMMSELATRKTGGGPRGINKALEDLAAVADKVTNPEAKAVMERIKALVTSRKEKAATKAAQADAQAAPPAPPA